MISNLPRRKAEFGVERKTALEAVNDQQKVTSIQKADG